MEIKAKARYIRMSPKKIRLVADLIRNLDVEEALVQLQFSNKRAAKPLMKLVNSAVASAEHDREIKKDNLKIKKLTVDDGPTLGRWMPRAFGRATTIRKRSSHISLLLEEKVPTKPKKKVDKKEKDKDLVKVADYKSVPKGAVPEIKSEETSEDKKETGETEDKKGEPFDKSRRGKHRHPDASEGKGKGQEGKGFLKKVFKRKSV